MGDQKKVCFKCLKKTSMLELSVFVFGGAFYELSQSWFMFSKSCNSIEELPNL